MACMLINHKSPNAFSFILLIEKGSYPIIIILSKDDFDNKIRINLKILSRELEFVTYNEFK